MRIGIYFLVICSVLHIFSADRNLDQAQLSYLQKQRGMGKIHETCILGSYYYSRGQKEKGFAYFKQAADKGNHYANIECGKYMMNEKKNYAGAKPFFQKAIEVGQNAYGGHLYMGALCIETKDYKEAHDSLVNAIARGARSHGWYYMAKLYKARGDSKLDILQALQESAKAGNQRAVQSVGSHYDAQNKIGMALKWYMKLKQPSQTIKNRIHTLLNTNKGQFVWAASLRAQIFNRNWLRLADVSKRIAAKQGFDQAKTSPKRFSNFLLEELEERLWVDAYHGSPASTKLLARVLQIQGACNDVVEGYQELAQEFAQEERSCNALAT